ncbi:MAG: substrate-binding domain-containing protein, partial [Eubacterium sp.]|nr:substrate-binding domain-containing protein [Eubacterium sp.]
DIIVECRVPATAMVDLAASEVSAILNKEDTVAVFGTNQTVTEGIIMANQNLDVLGSDPATDILGTGFDAGATIKEKIADGTLYGCVTQMPYAMGYYSICTLIANNNGEEVGDLAIPAYWYNADNMDDPLIAPNLYD